MGANLQAVVGKINIPSTPTDGQQLLDISNLSGLKANMFEFLKVTNEPAEGITDNVDVDIDFRYDIFSWLTGTRGNVKPLSDLDQIQAATKKFVQWIDAQKPGPILRSAEEWEQGYTESRLDELADGYVKTIYMIDFLLAFDYGQIAVVEDRCFYSDELDEFVTIWKHHPEGKTYHDLFGHFFIPFLQQAKEKGWQFVLFYVT